MFTKYTAAPSRLLLAAGITCMLAAALPAGAAIVDPDKAAIASVDRFSKDAAHLQLRTDTNGIPGPNQPVDFDTGPFNTQGLTPPVSYTHLTLPTIYSV